MTGFDGAAFDRWLIGGADYDDEIHPYCEDNCALHSWVGSCPVDFDYDCNGCRVARDAFGECETCPNIETCKAGWAYGEEGCDKDYDIVVTNY